jgi:hypothetical protein
VPESHENAGNVNPSSPQKKAPLAILAIVVIVAIIAWAALHHGPKTSENNSATNSVPVVSAPPVLFTNQEALKASDPRWAGVLGVLQSMKDWSEANPVCHMLITTEGMGGKTYSDTEMFRFKDADSTNLITRVKIHLRFPNEVTFIVEKTGEDVIAYLPETDQLLKVDAAKEIASQYGLDLQNPGTASFFSLLRIAFVETNDTHRALTFAFKPEVLNVPSAASADAFTTLRIDEKGALQTIEQTVGAEHHVMQVKYLGFQQDEVSRSAPQIPPNKPVVTGKAFNLALQEEIIKLRDKGTHI